MVHFERLLLKARYSLKAELRLQEVEGRITGSHNFKELLIKLVLEQWSCPDAHADSSPLVNLRGGLLLLLGRLSQLRLEIIDLSLKLLFLVHESLQLLVKHAVIHLRLSLHLILEYF